MPHTRLRSRRPSVSAWTRRYLLHWRLACFGLTLTALFVIWFPTGGARAAVVTPDTASSLSVTSQVGQPAPEFTVTTLDGLPLTSADLLAQEKPFILYFFATW